MGQDPGYEDVCRRCFEPRPDDWKASGWKNFCQNSLCNKCSSKRNNEQKRERKLANPAAQPAKRVTWKMHQAWLQDPANNDVRSECHVPRPETWQQDGRRGFREDSRCKRCANAERVAKRRAVIAKNKAGSSATAVDEEEFASAV